MNRLMELISEILSERFDDINKLIVDEVLDELIRLVLDTWHKNPEIAFEELKEKVIHTMNKHKDQS